MKSFRRNINGQARTLILVTQNRKTPYSRVIAAEKKLVWEAYKNYVAEKGDPWKVLGQVTSSEFKAAMSSAYKSKSKNLKFISKIRDENAGKCCSMCGSLNSGQVDHYLPQENYPEFSFFLPNLFPVCGCNQKKGGATVGSVTGERLLHPGYDRALGERSIFVKIRNHQTAPTYNVIFKKPKKCANLIAFDYHCKTLISKPKLVHHVRDKFEEFVRRPSSVSREFKRGDPNSKEALRLILLDEIEEACIHHQSKNNWDSVFLQALIEGRTLNWIWGMFSLEGRTANDPLAN
jgi:hypothetical protein